MNSTGWAVVVVVLVLVAGGAWWYTTQTPATNPAGTQEEGTPQVNDTPETGSNTSTGTTGSAQGSTGGSTNTTGTGTGVSVSAGAGATGSTGTTGGSTSGSTGGSTGSTGSAQTAPMSATVTYSSSGFSPASVTIAKGGTVTFVSQSGGMWVAADFHPTHGQYDGSDRATHCVAGFSPKPFDQCATGGSYSFTFTKTGSFGYHNHAAAQMGGTVIVK